MGLRNYANPCRHHADTMQTPKDAEHCRSRSLPSQPELQATSSPRMLYALLLPLLATWACAISPHLPPAAIDATAAAIGSGVLRGATSGVDWDPLKTESVTPRPPLASTPLVVVCLGGSATAGGGYIPRDNQYASLLGARLRQENDDARHPAVDGSAVPPSTNGGAQGGSDAVEAQQPGPTVLNMAHGMTDTFYTLL